MSNDARLSNRSRHICIEPGCGTMTNGKCRCPEHGKAHNLRQVELRKQHAQLRLNLKRNYPR